MILNETPVRTSRNFHINNVEIEDIVFPVKITEFENLMITGDIENFEITDNLSKENLKFGMNSILEEQVYNEANQELKISINDDKDKTLYIDFGFDEENVNLVDNIEITALEESKGTVVIRYLSNENEKFYHNGIIKARIEQNAQVNIILVNMLNTKSNNFIAIENEVHENAKLNYTIVDFGGKNSISNYYTNLIGDDSRSNLNTIYLGKENQFFDINYIAEQRGKRSKANIEVQGALKDEAKKNFKGTIDLKKGCKKSVGSENEFCMLLSSTAKSKALPMLLCTEEDVEGNHSTASGKVDEKKLFYIMSRGISKQDAMKLIVKANFNNIINTIKDDGMKEFILKEIDSKLD